jgi:hypothetical protein
MRDAKLSTWCNRLQLVRRDLLAFLPGTRFAKGLCGGMMTHTGIGLLNVGLAIAALTSAIACGSNAPATPASPSVVVQTPTPPAPAPPSSGATLSAPVPKFPIAFELVAVRKPNLVVANAVTTGNVGTVTYQFEVSELDSFPATNRTSSSGSIPQGDNVTSWQPPSDLIPQFLYYWHARATNGTMTTEWSKTETFRTP